MCRDHAQYPAFIPGTSEVAVGLWPFCILLFIICPICVCMQLFLVPYSLYSVARGDVCLDANASTLVDTGPRSQPILFSLFIFLL